MQNASAIIYKEGSLRAYKNGLTIMKRVLEFTYQNQTPYAWDELDCPTIRKHGTHESKEEDRLSLLSFMKHPGNASVNWEDVLGEHATRRIGSLKLLEDEFMMDKLNELVQQLKHFSVEYAGNRRRGWDVYYVQNQSFLDYYPAC